MLQRTKTKSSAIGASIVVLLITASPALAGPAYYWWHMDLGISHSECAKRAGVVIATEIVVDKIDKNPDGATATNKNTSMIIYCTSKGKNKTEAIIFASGFNGQETKVTMQQLRDGMKSAIHE
jgi:hypothetical protein